MNKLTAEFEIFCYIVQTKPQVIYIPIIWLIFCGGLAMMVGSLGVDSGSVFYELVQHKLQKQHSKIVMMGIFGYVLLTWMLYHKQRKRLF